MAVAVHGDLLRSRWVVAGRRGMAKRAISMEKRAKNRDQPAARSTDARFVTLGACFLGKRPPSDRFRHRHRCTGVDFSDTYRRSPPVRERNPPQTACARTYRRHRRTLTSQRPDQGFKSILRGQKQDSIARQLDQFSNRGR